MAKIVVNEECCKACGLCIEACPKGLIELSNSLNSQGYHPARQTDAEQCNACKLCALVCPDICIAVYK